MRSDILILIGMSLCPIFGGEANEEKARPVPTRAKLRNELTNDGIALLASAGYSEQFLIDLIYHKHTRFDVSAEGLAWLAEQGLSERLVRVMVAAASLENLPVPRLPATKWYLIPETPVPDRKAKNKVPPNGGNPVRAVVVFAE